MAAKSTDRWTETLCVGKFQRNNEALADKSLVMEFEFVWRNIEGVAYVGGALWFRLSPESLDMKIKKPNTVDDRFSWKAPRFALVIVLPGFKVFVDFRA